MHLRIGLLAAALLVGTAAQSAAQSASADPGHARTDIAGGYAWLREMPPGGGDATTYPRGWVIAGAHQVLFERLLAVGEIGNSARSNIVEETQQVRAFLGGVRVRLTRGARMATFGQVLVGSHRFSEPGFSESGLAVQPGGGLDLRVMRGVGLRGQVDYRLAHEGTATFKQLRVSIGAVLWFGK